MTLDAVTLVETSRGDAPGNATTRSGRSGGDCGVHNAHEAVNKLHISAFSLC